MAWFQIPAWMIVAKNDRIGVYFERRGKNKLWVCDGGGCATGGKAIDSQNMVSAI